MAATLLPPLPTEPPHDQVRPRDGTRRHALTAQALYANNPFSWRVDLNPSPAVLVDDGTTPAADVARVNPLLAEVCTQVSVSIVTEAVDPHESLTVLQGPDDQQPLQRRVGDRIGDYEVAYIGFNRTKASPAVWLTSSTGLCQTLLFTPRVIGETAPSADAKSDPQAKPTAPRAGTAPAKSTLPAELASRITKLNDNHVKVQRSVVEHVLADPSVFMGAARLVPAKDSETQSSSIRLFGVREGTLLGALNLKNGDVLTRINGFELSSPEQALNAYARLRTAETLSVEVLRRGKPVTLQVSIE